ncbi:aldehyde dehydrogenase family protein [Gordonia sp. 'Campus']|uniref:aldehyde dehydrogenase family protein n=1 Tax=Gordonia sp. 'Campus' TaxID=2915824 RepID=UPI001EE41FED|nr:aldehyde dehydrogenase family protein [Gordonia sp. 'Campus']
MQTSTVIDPATAVRRYGLFIDGGFDASDDRPAITRHSPVDGRELAVFTAGDRADTVRAIASARRAFDHGPWPRTSSMDRARTLLRVADLMRANADRLARIETEETGKPLRYAESDVAGSAELFEYAAGLAMSSHGEAHTGLAEDCTAMVVREPAGVAAMILPWNFPLLLLAQKLPFALAAGCTAVVKPSEFTSGTALELAAILTAAGVPDGVVNVVTGYGADVGAVLAESADVDLLSFTGSTATGHAITAASAGTAKRLSMELGGKAANIVFDDADLDDALDGVLFGAFFNNGECCVAGSRLLVQDSIADTFVERLVAAAGRVRVGDPFDSETDVGPMIHAGHLEKVRSHIASAESHGGRIAVGGGVPRDAATESGHFVEPTIVLDVTESAPEFHQEIFGPVLTVTRFADAAEAIALANATEYGLSGSLWTKNIDRALSVAKKLRSGRVWVNTTIDGGPQLPAGGMKQSGYGREMGIAGFEEFTEVKTIQIREGKRNKAFPHIV